MSTPTPSPVPPYELPHDETYQPQRKSIREVGEIIVSSGESPIRELVGHQDAMKSLTEQLALKILHEGAQFDFIAAAGTDGMIWATQLRKDLEMLSGGERQIPLVYIRDAKKSGGHGEHITGANDNPAIPQGANALIVGDELSEPDRAQNAMDALREKGYGIGNYATVLDQENPATSELLAQQGVNRTALLNQVSLDDLDRGAVDTESVQQRLAEERRQRDASYARREASKYQVDHDPAQLLIQSGAVSIKDIQVLSSDALGLSDEQLVTLVNQIPAEQKPFLYSSGNWGPGYVTVKEQVGKEQVMDQLVDGLAKKLVASEVDFDFITANATGGMIPGYLLRERLQQLTGRDIPYVYAKNTRGQNADISNTTGLANNPEIPVGSRAIVVEELVNFASTTTNSAELLRANGFAADHAATILHYENPEAIRVLGERGVDLVSSVTLPGLLQTAEQFFPASAMDGYREFLANPKDWQTARNLRPIKR